MSYFDQAGLSNSGLSQFEQGLSTQDAFDSYEAFRLGTLCDAVITEHAKVNYILFTIQDQSYTYTREEFAWALRMRVAFFLDVVCKMLHRQSSFQVEMFVMVDFGGEIGLLYCKCKFDGFIWSAHWGWDLKSTMATTEAQFDHCIDRFNYDRAAYFYMEVSKSDRFCILGVSKKNQKIFKRFIVRGDPVWCRGRDKCHELLKKYVIIYGNN